MHPDKDEVTAARPATTTEPAPAESLRKRDKLTGQLISTATKLVPLLELVERIRPHMTNDSVFTSRREKMHAQLVLIQQQLKADQPKHEALVLAFKTLGEFVVEESREVSKDEVKESAKRLVLVALKTAPDLIRAAHTAGLFS
jgi:hypothetical protein